MLEQYARARGISTLTIFQQAHKAYGLNYGLRSAEEMHKLWSQGWVCLPYFVHLYIQRTLKKEDLQEEQWLPFL